MSDRAAINPRDGTHESLCTQETRVCWAEFVGSLLSLSLGLVCVLVGVSVDSSAVGPNAGRLDKDPAAPGARAATYIGVALLVVGAALMVAFGVHFYVVKRRLDRVKLHRFARFGIRPASRYSALPPELEEAAAAAPADGKGIGISVVTSSASPSSVCSVASSSVLPTGSGFFNLGFSGAAEDSRPPAESRSSSAATSGIGSSAASSSLVMAAAHLLPAAAAAPHQLRGPPEWQPQPQPQPPIYFPYRSSQI